MEEDTAFAVIDNATKTVKSSIPDILITYKSIAECLLNKIHSQGDKEILVDYESGRKWTGITLRDTVIHTANVLSNEIGLKKGQIVAFYAPNSDYHLILQMAVMAAGGIYTGCPNGLKYREITNHVLAIEADYLVCTKETLETAENLRSNFDVWKVIVIDGEEKAVYPHNNILSLKSMLTLKDSPDILIPVPCDIQKDIAALLPSSGIKGTPKMVIRTHENLLHLAMHLIHPVNAFFTSDKDITICYQPISLQLGLVVVWPALMTGAKVLLLNGFDAERYVNIAAEHGITSSVIVPSHVEAVIDYSIKQKKELINLKHIVTMGAHLSDYCAERAKRHLKIKSLRAMYSMIELGLATILPRGIDNANVVGIPFPGVEIKIKKPKTDEVLGPNQIGEICVKSKQVTPGYYKIDSSSYFDDQGFFKTGDSGYYDNDGYFRITDHYKELIKCDGQQVSPEELEQLILSHRSIQEVAVVGVDDEKHGQVPKAFIIAKPRSSITPEDVDEYIRDQVAPWKQLRGGVVFLDVLPTDTSTGQTDRRRLSIY